LRDVSDADVDTSNFRRQHKELMKLAGELMALLEAERVRQRVHDVLLSLARFNGKLRIHAAMENDALYPRLLTDPDEAVQRAAQVLYDEVGDLYRTFDRHARRWSSTEAIAGDAEMFIAETMELLRRLGARMMRENAELYPLVDARAGVALSLGST
jgi:hypothetical protein